MSEEPKIIQNPQLFLRENGLLFEINRTILHPLGLALAVMPNDDDKESSHFSLYYTNDKEGYLYSEETFLDGARKFLEFNTSQETRINDRIEELGYFVQELADAYAFQNGVTLTTYNPEFDGEEGDDLLSFTVPADWLTDVIAEWHDMGLAEFLDWYTYDVSENIYEAALEDEVIISESTKRDVV